MNDTQAQAGAERRVQEVEAYVRGKGYDDRGSANAFYGNFFYAYHDARAWRRADGTPVLDWRAGGGRVARDESALPRAKTWPRRCARSDSGASGAVPGRLQQPRRFPSAAPCLRSRSRTWPPSPRPTPRSMRRSCARPASRRASPAASPREWPPRRHAYDARLARGGGLYIYGPRGVGKTEMACRIAYDYAGSRLDPRFGNWAYRRVPKGGYNTASDSSSRRTSDRAPLDLRQGRRQRGRRNPQVRERPGPDHRRPGQGLLDPVGAREAVPDRQRPLRGRARHDRHQPVHPGGPRRGAVGVRPQGGRPGYRLAPGRDDRERVKMDGWNARMAPCDAEGAGR